MQPTELTRLTRETLINYFVSAFKPRAEWLIGMEAEKLPRAASDGAPVPYDGSEPSIRGLLEFLLAERGGTPVYEGEHLIGIDGAWGSISLEPGGQVEWSSRPRATLGELRDDLDSHLAILRRAGDVLGVRFLEVGVDPELPVERMEWMPKARYKIMRPYMGARGRLAHRMMTQTASIQCAFDFESGQDWARKFRTGVLMAPVAVALFANSSRIDGADSGYRSFRQAIWRETEPARCGIPPVVFEPGFGIERWVDWLCDVPSMFRHRGRGLVPSGGTPFRELLRLGGCDALKMEDWELHVSSVFTEVRSYRYVEVRSADLQPDGAIPAVPTFWTGILYDDRAMDGALQAAAAWNQHRAWEGAMDAAARDGLDGSAAGVSLRDVASRVLALALSGLGRTAAAADPERDAAPLRDLARRHSIELEG